MDVNEKLAAAREKKTEIRRQREDLKLQEDLVDAETQLLAEYARERPLGERPARTKRVHAVLAQAGPLRPKRLAERLCVREPEVEEVTVRTTSGHPRCQGRVEDSSRGRWVMVGGRDS